MTLEPRGWVPEICETRVQGIAGATARQPSAEIAARVEALAQETPPPM